MQTMHLFAGAGGGLLADLILGHRPIIAVEWDKYACSVLRARAADGWFPELSVYEGDVRMFDPSEYKGRVDCIHAGFPCQDISVAGKQAGVGEETRSGLYREVLRIADVVRPRELYLENVSAILNNGLGTVLADLSALGYSARWICVRASDVGANHHRDRWWLLARRNELAYSNSTQCKGKQLLIGNSQEISWTRNSGALLSDTMCVGQQGSWKHERQINSTKDCTREADRVINKSQTREGWWQSEPNVGGMVDELASQLDGDRLDDKKFNQEDRSESNKRIWDELPAVRINRSASPTPSRLQQATGGGDCVREMPRDRTREPEMGEQTKDKSMCVLREDICFQETKRENMQPVMREQIGVAHSWWEVEPNIGRVAEGVKYRVGKLKALGNGQVPLQAAVAYSILSELFT